MSAIQYYRKKIVTEEIKCLCKHGRLAEYFTTLVGVEGGIYTQSKLCMEGERLHKQMNGLFLLQELRDRVSPYKQVFSGFFKDEKLH